jgi:hypothetical protein
MAAGAQKAPARAAYEATEASYRQTVLTGFQEVENNLAALRIFQEEAQVQEEPVWVEIGMEKIRRCGIILTVARGRLGKQGQEEDKQVKPRHSYPYAAEPGPYASIGLGVWPS